MVDLGRGVRGGIWGLVFGAWRSALFVGVSVNRLPV
jgi:hypothetical protein